MAVRLGIARQVPVRARVPVCEGVFSAPTTCALCLPARLCVGARAGGCALEVCLLCPGCAVPGLPVSGLPSLVPALLLFAF